MLENSKKREKHTQTRKFLPKNARPDLLLLQLQINTSQTSCNANMEGSLEVHEQEVRFDWRALGDAA